MPLQIDKTKNRINPLVCHTYEKAPRFFGRKKELSSIDSFWKSNSGKVLAITGIGGSGKTAIVAKWIELFFGDEKKLKEANAIFIWSFYENNSSELFLKELYKYIFYGTDSIDTGISLLLDLQSRLAQLNKVLIVLDGLEKVQLDTSFFGSLLGKIEDSNLRALLKFAAEGISNIHVIITSRYPISDLNNKGLKAFRQINIEDIPNAAACNILKSHGIDASVSLMKFWIREFGQHALTIDHLGGYISRYLDSDITRADEIPQLPERIKGKLGSLDEKGAKLFRVLSAYKQRLSTAELFLVQIIAFFRGPVEEDYLLSIVRNQTISKYKELKTFSDNEIRAVLSENVWCHLLLKDKKGSSPTYSCHVAIRDFFASDISEKDSDLLHNNLGAQILSLTSSPGIQANILPDEVIYDLGNVFYHSVKSGSISEAIKIFHKMGGIDHLLADRGLHDFVGQLLKESFDFELDNEPEELRLKRFYDYWLTTLLLNGTIDPDTAYTLSPGKWDFAEYIKKLQDGLLHSEYIPIEGNWGLPFQRSVLFLDPKRYEIFLEKLPKHYDDICRIELAAAEAMIRLGVSHSEKKIMDIIERAENRVSKTNEKDILVYKFIVSASNYIKTNSFESAIDQIEYGLKLSELWNYKIFTVDLLNLKSLLLIIYEKYSEALEVVNSAIELAISVNYYRGRIISLIKKAFIFSKINNPRKAIVEQVKANTAIKSLGSSVKEHYDPHIVIKVNIWSVYENGWFNSLELKGLHKIKWYQFVC